MTSNPLEKACPHCGKTTTSTVHSGGALIWGKYEFVCSSCADARDKETLSHGETNKTFNKFITYRYVDQPLLSDLAESPVIYEGVTFPTVEQAWQVARRTRPNWDEMEMSVMEDILRQKFSIPTFRLALLETGDTQIVTDDGNGKDRFGKLLMKIRKDLKK